MRRKDREIRDLRELLEVIGGSRVCRLGMADGENPYVVPLNFGYEYRDGVLWFYFHGAGEGRKIDILKKNNAVCVEVDGGHALVEGEDIACAYGFAFESVIAQGRAEFIEGPAEKIRALNILMRHQTGTDREFNYDQGALGGVCVFQVRVSGFTGKRKTLPGSPPQG
jgi:nitroimidazol reductase NimA-like FMN-containing flavoprotein (pyridoxamine 5'-phosphate oxidase superfamily)